MLLSRYQSVRWPEQPGALPRRCRGAAQEAGRERPRESPEGLHSEVRPAWKMSMLVGQSAWRWHVQIALVGCQERNLVLAWIRVESRLAPQILPYQCLSRRVPSSDRETFDKRRQ